MTKELQRALSRLDGTADRPIARRNARRRVLFALRKIRAWIDAEYPAIITKKARPRLTIEGRRKRLIRAGWRQTSRAGLYAAEGVPVRKIETDHMIELWIPGWASAIGHDQPSQLRAAKKSVKLQHAAVATEALRSTS